MNLKIDALKNVSASWFGLAANLVVGFFLSPFILHRLGDDAFGLWILVFSITGYYGLFNLGIRSSIIKYVASAAATHDDDQMAHVINTGLFSFGAVAGFLLLLTAAGSWYVDSIFHIAPTFLRTARLLFLMVGSALALGLPLGVFAGVLQGLQKFHWLNLTQVAATLVRALLIVLALHRGGGLLTVAFITVALPLASYGVYILIVYRLLPLRLGIKYVDRKALRSMVNYGSVTFMIIVAGKLRFQSDAMVIGIFMSAAAITYFSIGSKLVDYATGFTDGVADLFLPMSSHFDARGEVDQLRKVLIIGNRACALTMFPICAALIVLGKPLIAVWVGPKYVSSYGILVLLLIPRTVYRAQGASTRILFGMNRHRTLAIVTLVEGVANLVLSIALIRPWGIVGDAVGTAIPLLCTSLFFLPRHLCRLLDVPVITFLRQAYLLPLVLCAPMVATLLLLQRVFYAHTYLQLLVQMLAGGVVYSTGVLWLFVTTEPMGVKLRLRFTEFLQHAFNR